MDEVGWPPLTGDRALQDLIQAGAYFLHSEILRVEENI